MCHEYQYMVQCRIKMDRVVQSSNVGNMSNIAQRMKGALIMIPKIYGFLFLIN